MKWWRAISSARVVISTITVVASLALAFYPWRFWEEAALDHTSTWVRGGVLALWSFVPPLWFLVEYGMFDGQPADFERLKYLQDLSSKLWAGMLAALTILYFGKDILHK
jgi:hypothetical protein